MNFWDIPLYTILPEVQECVANLYLQNSDTATMLGIDGYGLRSIYDLYGTEYEDIIPAYVSCREGESWGMRGTVYKFRLTDELKAHILRESLTCMFKVGDKYILENLALYSGESCIFSCCSHEAFDLDIPEIVDQLKDAVFREVKAAIERTELFAQMQAVCNGLPEKPDSAEKKDLEILLDLCCYVDQAKKMFIYQPPKYECDFITFRDIAKKYLSQSTYAVLEGINDYADLQPLPSANTVEQVLAAPNKFAPQYIHSDYYRQVKSEILMLKYIRSSI